MKWLWWTLSGLCLALISVDQVFWWLVFPGFILVIHSIIKAPNWHSVALGGWLVGTLKSMGGYAWGWSTFPMAWVSLGSLGQIFLISAYWLSTSIPMGLGIAAACFLLFIIWQKARRFFWWSLPVVWLIGEVLGSFLASVILLGPGVPLGMGIGHGHIGIALANIILFYPFVSLGGMYGLTFMSAALGASLYFVWIYKNWFRSKKIFWTGFAFVSLLTFYVVFPIAPVPISGKRVVAIDTRISTERLQESDGETFKARQEIGAVLAAAKTAPDIILLPEDARLTTYLGGPEQTLAALQSKVSSNTVVVDSARVDEVSGAVLRAFYYDLGRNAIYATDKQFLIPQGEYVTYPFIWSLKLLGQKEALDKALKNQNYRPGEANDYQLFPADVPGILFCSESSYVNGIPRVSSLRESSIVLHAISHARFHNPHILWFQLDSMVRAQAIYTNKSVVTAANMAESKIYTPDGRISTGNKILETEFFDLIEYNL